MKNERMNRKAGGLLSAGRVRVAGHALQRRHIRTPSRDRLLIALLTKFK